MTRTALLPALVSKEIRALSLRLAGVSCDHARSGRWWAPARSGRSASRRTFFGAAALGALSIGHEYSHRTLTLLLAQPARRERLFLAKFGVLLAMLLTLVTVAAVVLFSSSGSLRGPRSLLQSEYGLMGACGFPCSAVCSSRRG